MSKPARSMVTSFERRRWVAGWACSVLLHAAVVGAALGVMTNLRPAAEKEPFRWEVSLVEALRQDVAAEPAQTADAPPVAQPRRQPSPIEPVRSAEQPVRRRLETKPIVERIERQVREVVTAVQQAKPVMAVESRTIAPQPIQQPETMLRELAPVQRVEDAVSVHTAAPVTADVKPVVAEPVVAAKPSAAVVQRPEPTAISTVETSSPAPIVRPPVIRPPVAEQPALTPVVREPVAVADPAPANADPAPPLQSDSVTRESHPQVVLAPRSAPPAKVDYGWLAESLWRRVVELKRYPQEARLNRWEGKVVLKAVIREDGHLGDLQIQQSSGYDILDRDAMELVRKACPLHLKHPLGRPEVVVQIPINYALR